MTALPAATAFTDSAITKGQFKTAMTDLRAFLAGLMGADGTIQTALDALNAIFAAGVVAKSGAYTVATADRGVLLNCTGTWTLTLLAAATAGNGFAFSVANTGSGVITIDANASELIEGNLTITVPAGASIVLVCDGTGWVRVGQDSEIPIPIAKGGTGAITAAAALAALGGIGADMGHANVGSLVFACPNNTGNVGDTINPGTSYAGSKLNPCSTIGDDFHATALSGTWRCLGYGRKIDNISYGTLWQRIA